MMTVTTASYSEDFEYHLAVYKYITKKKNNHIKLNPTYCLYRQAIWKLYC